MGYADTDDFPIADAGKSTPAQRAHFHDHYSKDPAVRFGPFP